MVRKIIEPASDLFKTVGTINRADIPTRGIFSKGRTHVLDKLILCPVSRYFLRKFFSFGDIAIKPVLPFLLPCLLYTSDAADE